MFKRIIGPAAISVAVALGGAFALATSASASTSTPAAQSQTSAPSVGKWVLQHRRAIRRAVIAATAKDISVTPQDLVSELRSGKSIAQVASEHGVGATTVQNDLVTSVDNAVNKLLGKGRITSSQASKIEARVPTLVGKLVNKTF